MRWDGWKEFLFAGDVQSMDLLRKYKVEYIYLSHSEMEIFKPNMAYLNLQFPIIYQNGDITIYKVPGETVVN